MDKSCQVQNSKAYRTTCNTFGNGAQVEAVADKEFVVEEYSVNSCDQIPGKQMIKSTVLTVDGQCQNFYFNNGNVKKTVWYRAVKTTGTLNRPGVDPAPSGPKCVNNQLDSGDQQGERCVEWEGKAQQCSKMAFEGDGAGLYKKRSRLQIEQAPQSNLCKATCLDRGDVFCVDKKDLMSNPICCPKECEDPNKNGVNQCSQILKQTKSHVCSDQFTKAREEFKYLLCPREDMEQLCGDKIIKFDFEKDNKKTFKYSVPWYLPGSEQNDGDFPIYKFNRKGICNYVFIMPSNVAVDSSFEISFKGSENTNRNVQAYVAQYSSSPDEMPSIGDVMAQYDGDWTYFVPADAT